MATDAESSERIEELQQEMEQLLEDASEGGEEVSRELRKTREEIEYLEENAGAADREEAEELAGLFIRTCRQIVEEYRAESEIGDEIERLEEDEKTYVKLLNRIQEGEMPEEKRERMKKRIGKIPRERVESAIQEDRDLERQQVNEIRDQIDRMSRIYSDKIRADLKRHRMKTLHEKVREAWVRLTHLEAEI